MSKKNGSSLNRHVKSAPIVIPMVVDRGLELPNSIVAFENGKKLLSLLQSRKFDEAKKLLGANNILFAMGLVDFTYVDSWGNTALHYAVEARQLEIAELIIKLGGKYQERNTFDQAFFDCLYPEDSQRSRTLSSRREPFCNSQEDPYDGDIEEVGDIEEMDPGSFEELTLAGESE